MAKKGKSTSIVVAAASSGGQLADAVRSMPTIDSLSFANLKVDHSLPLSEQRRQVAMQLGLRKPRKVYESPQARKAAAKARADAKRELKRQAYAKAGIPFGVRKKMTPEERKQHRTEKRHEKKDILSWGKTFMKEHPEEARKYGIDPTKFKF
jgi:hypothetical protein